jgi:hypothetical protein
MPLVYNLFSILQLLITVFVTDEQRSVFWHLNLQSFRHQKLCLLQYGAQLGNSFSSPLHIIYQAVWGGGKAAAFCWSNLL